MSGVPIVRACLEVFRGSTAHVCISEMDSSGIQPCRENGNNLKLVVNYRYIPIYSIITMDSNNPKILAPTPNQ